MAGQPVAAGFAGTSVERHEFQVLPVLPSPRKKVFIKAFGFLSETRHRPFFLKPDARLLRASILTQAAVTRQPSVFGDTPSPKRGARLSAFL